VKEQFVRGALQRGLWPDSHPDVESDRKRYDRG